jgi:predicted nucleic acid-binding Zn ribbon protein
MRKRVDIRWVRRTLARVEWLFDRVRAEQLAGVLVAHGVPAGTLQFLGQCLDDTAECMKGVRPDAHRLCVVCGQDVDPNDPRRRDARYCSRACRQRAYRTRVTGHPPGEPRPVTGPAACDTSSTDRQVTCHTEVGTP